MSTIKSSSEDLTLNADGSNEVKFQINAVEKASINSSGLFTSTTIDATALTGNLPAISGASLTNLPAANLTGIDDNAVSNAITISANQEVTMPSQPAFSASMSDQLNLSVGSFVKVLFDAEVFDQNADFDTTTNTFTAPVSGRYLFTMYLEAAEIDTAASQLRFDLNTSNDNLMEWNRLQPNVDGASDYRKGASGSILADMDASDTAIVQVYVNPGAAQMDLYGCGRFEGVLIC